MLRVGLHRLLRIPKGRVRVYVICLELNLLAQCSRNIKSNPGRHRYYKGHRLNPRNNLHSSKLCRVTVCMHRTSYRDSSLRSHRVRNLKTLVASRHRNHSTRKPKTTTASRHRTRCSSVSHLRGQWAVHLQCNHLTNANSTCHTTADPRTMARQ